MIINYTGENTYRAIDSFCKDHSVGCYVLYQTIFSDVVITKHNKLPTSKHAASDWQNGYYHNGKHFEWSASRKIVAQNASNTKD
jgi:hypothetical protein